ncbi:MAG TPA: DUF2007 domain-containing protein [Pirellulales bacterium]|nr:DUF2007 domain-containing protein [Pirellulales bacterium]
MNRDELATVYTTTHPADAEMVRMALAEEGLAAFVEGGKQAGLTGILDVRVCVAQENAEQARRLIDDLDRSPLSAEAWDEALEAAAAEPGGEDSGEPADEEPDR